MALNNLEYISALMPFIRDSNHSDGNPFILDTFANIPDLIDTKDACFEDNNFKFYFENMTTENITYSFNRISDSYYRNDQAHIIQINNSRLRMMIHHILRNMVFKPNIVLLYNGEHEKLVIKTIDGHMNKCYNMFVEMRRKMGDERVY